MADKLSLEEQMRQAAVKRMWLNYFNDTLLEQGVITPEEHRRMLSWIVTKPPPRGR